MKAEAPKKKRRKPWRQATELTRRHYERAGYRIAFVERQIKLRAAWGGKLTRKLDAWGFADHIAFKVGKPGMTAINSCKGFRELAEHVEKFRLLSAAWDWLEHDPNNRIVILAWDRPKAKGLRVRMRCRQLRKADFEPRPGDCCLWKPKGVKRKELGGGQKGVSCESSTEQVARCSGSATAKSPDKTESPLLRLHVETPARRQATARRAGGV